MASKTHYRLCHRCGTANSSEEKLVTTCRCCGKHLAPFYFFDESRAMGLKNSNFYSTGRPAAPTSLPHAEYPAIRGLTAYWES